MTLNPLTVDAFYTPSSNTLVDWGGWPVPGVTIAPEFYYYSKIENPAEDFYLEPDSVRAILNPRTSEFGLGTWYNCARFTISLFLQSGQADILRKFNDALKFNSLPVNFWNPMRYHVEAYLMGGSFVVYDIEDYIHGFETDVAYKVNGGSFKVGDFFALQSSVTPILNDRIGEMSSQQISIFSGENCHQKRSSIHKVNGAAYINKNKVIFNGVQNITTP